MTTTTPLRLLSLVLSLAACAASSAQEAPAPPKPAEKPVDAEALSVTEHTFTAGGRTLKYHVTTGYMVMKAEEAAPPAEPPGAQAGAPEGKEPPKDGLKPKAKIFFIAYTLDDVADPAARPVTFAFNGGPGSSSIWLHMAALAPRRAQLSADGEAPPPPYRLEDNESTWLDRTDLVFIDPVSTGYSRPFPDESAQQFHGLAEDIASVGDFIRLWTTRNARWLSPKIVVGESYGTTRAAGLSDYLQDRYGLYLNGIVLVSAVLSFQTLEFTPQNVDPYVGFLPTYAVSAWYHKRLSAQYQAMGVAELAQRARDFASGEYALALARGDMLGAEDAAAVAGQLAHFTGLPASYWQQRRLRLPDGIWFSKLLEEQGRMTGRLDSRFTGLRYEPGTENFEYDPSMEAINGPMTAVFNDYVRRELKFESDLPYETLTNVGPWNFGDARNGFPNTAEALRRAMIRHPYLKVWVTCGYYDVATPFFAAENTVALMNLDPSVRRNLRFTYYEAGHMHYIHQPSREQFSKDFDAFLGDALSTELVPAAAR